MRWIVPEFPDAKSSIFTYLVSWFENAKWTNNTFSSACRGFCGKPFSAYLFCCTTLFQHSKSFFIVIVTIQYYKINFENVFFHQAYGADRTVKRSFMTYVLSGFRPGQDEVWYWFLNTWHLEPNSRRLNLYIILRCGSISVIWKRGEGIENSTLLR